MSLGMLGGAFDPPHLGHVALARAAIAELELDRLLLLVVADPGHKGTVAAASARLELVRLAFADVFGAEVELDEHERTVDSLEARQPADALFVIGADEFADFHRWERPERVLELVRLAVGKRPGVSPEALRKAQARLPSPDRIVFFALEPVPVSSTEVRERVASGKPIDDLVPAPVAGAIERLGLYRNGE